MSSENVTDAPALLVAVHLQKPDGAAGRFLAYGFMTGPASVLVPDPPQDVTNAWQRYVVRISPSPGTDDAAETIRVGGVSVAAVNKNGVSTAAAALTLVWPTEFDVPDVSATPEKIAELLIRHHGDQWVAFADLGFRVVHPEEPLPPDAWWLAPKYAPLLSSSVEGYSRGVCGTSPTCGHHLTTKTGFHYPASTD
ncbi:hypothetical protein ABTX81_23645 [Kitasatospora sp. NPDC097605]|uniref:hypothetical protein n=1 Tax=Kitasatospora sp. NPDC097605 TaxID=3157226 RepID=UPI003316DD55